MKQHKIRPDDEPIRCNFVRCFFGSGLAGVGRCLANGEWWNPGCPEYKTENEYLEEWKMEAKDE